MGYIETHEDLYRLARDKVDADSGDFGSSAQDAYLPQNKSVDILKLNIATEMESFRWPFAIVRTSLSNELVDEGVTHSEGEKVNRLYQLPHNVANIIGVYHKDNIPFIEAFLSDYSSAVALSITVSKIGSDRILIPNVEGDLFLVYITSTPPIKDMNSAFQKFLIADLATHIYLGGVRGRNSNMYRHLKLDAVDAYSAAKLNVLTNLRDYRKLLPTMLDVAYTGNKDGQVGPGYLSKSRVTREILRDD